MEKLYVSLYRKIWNTFDFKVKNGKILKFDYFDVYKGRIFYKLV